MMEPTLEVEPIKLMKPCIFMESDHVSISWMCYMQRVHKHSLGAIYKFTNTSVNAWPNKCRKRARVVSLWVLGKMLNLDKDRYRAFFARTLGILTIRSLRIEAFCIQLVSSRMNETEGKTREYVSSSWRIRSHVFATDGCDNRRTGNCETEH